MRKETKSVRKETKSEYDERMLAASCGRIFAGTGLTWDNLDEYSAENYYDEEVEPFTGS